MKFSVRFELNANEVVYELLDGEIIVMHLQSGNYYSLVGSGADIWERVITGAASDAICARLVDEVTAEPEIVEAELHRFLQQLVDESLIIPASDRLAELAMLDPAPRPGPRRPFAPPTIQKYTDMQGLLLVDPIHEVDATGWPSVDASGH